VLPPACAAPHLPEDAERRCIEARAGALRPLAWQAQWQTIDWRSELLEPTGELKSDIIPVPKELPKELAELGDKLKAVQLPTPTLPPIERDSPFASLIQREVQARSTGEDAERLPVTEGPQVPSPPSY